MTIQLSHEQTAILELLAKALAREDNGAADYFTRFLYKEFTPAEVAKALEERKADPWVRFNELCGQAERADKEANEAMRQVNRWRVAVRGCGRAEEDAKTKLRALEREVGPDEWVMLVDRRNKETGEYNAP